jgi:arylsulfatase B
MITNNRVISFALVALLLSVCSVNFAFSSESPNIIVIVADDLGYADMSFLSHSPEDVQTPGIDRLAAMGTYFTDAYATSPICSPSRTGLLTGRYQQRWGNYWYGQGGLPDAERTIPQFLKERGYYTIKIGKTHLNGGPAQHPLDHGFDEFLGFISHTWDYVRLSQDDLDAYRERAEGKGLGMLFVGPLTRGRDERVSYEDGFTTEIFTDEAVMTIEAGKENPQPFFIELEYNAVHMPTYVTHPDYAQRVGLEPDVWDREAEEWEFPFWDPAKSPWGEWHKKWGHLEEVDPQGRKRYLSHLMAMDDGISKILDTLDATGQTENTIIVFLSDNGGTINTYSNNNPLRGYKYMFGEGGIRVPLIVAWPGQLPEGDTCGNLVSAMDVCPTLLDLTGTPRPKNLDGESLTPLLRGQDDSIEHDHICWAQRKTSDTWAIRKGPWKLISSEGWIHLNYALDENNVASRTEDYEYPAGLLLFNLEQDIGETTNLANEHPDVVRELSLLFEEWRAEVTHEQENRQ